MIITITKTDESTRLVIDTEDAGSIDVIEVDGATVGQTATQPTTDEDGFRDLIDPKAAR